MCRLAKLILSAIAVFQLSEATAQTMATPPDMLPAETVFRLTNFTIGKQSFLFVVPAESSEAQNDSISGHSLAALLNFFLEVPVPAGE
jgi:hypothetical protein